MRSQVRHRRPTRLAATGLLCILLVSAASPATATPYCVGYNGWTIVCV